MTNIVKKQDLTASQLFATKSVQQRFEQLLGAKAQGFITSALQAVQSNKLLAKADPQTILSAAATAAALDLPINQSLGLAWIVPYKGQAQFQLGWRGFVQLALRSGEYKNMNVLEVYENQFQSWNPLTEDLKADFMLEPEGETVGYVAYMKMNDGFEKTDYWTKERVIKHAKKYSQAYNSSNQSPWKDPDQFDAMAKKTVLKNLISKWGLMSIDRMQKAVEADQSVIKGDDQFEYVDNPTIDLETDEPRNQEEVARIRSFIEKAKTKQELEDIQLIPGGIPDELDELFETKTKQINGSKN